MIYFITGLIFGVCITIGLYSLVVAENISSLQNENAKLVDDIQRLEYDLHKARYVYEGFDETK